LLGKTITKVKLEEGVEDLMKGERKMKWKFESGVGVGKVGEINPSFENSKLELGELMNIVGLELESSRTQLVKLKKEKEELTFELGQGKIVLHKLMFWKLRIGYDGCLLQNHLLILMT
jgi:hypothetical protein